MKNALFFFVIVFLMFLSCDSGSSSSYESSTGVNALPRPAVDRELEMKDRKIITSGEIRFETTALAVAQDSIRKLMEQHGAYLEEERSAEGKRQTTNYWTVRIPSDQTSAFVQALEERFAPFDRKNILSRDITEEFIDVTARLKTRKALEDRLLQLLDRAEGIDEILRMERELSEVRGEIESMEQRVKMLSNKSNYSTLHLEFYVQKTPARRFFQKMGENFIRGWDLFLGFLIGLVRLWPFFLLFALVYYLWRRYRKKKTSL